MFANDNNKLAALADVVEPTAANGNPVFALNV